MISELLLNFVRTLHLCYPDFDKSRSRSRSSSEPRSGCIKTGREAEPAIADVSGHQRNTPIPAVPSGPRAAAATRVGRAAVRRRRGTATRHRTGPLAPGRVSISKHQTTDEGTTPGTRRNGIGTEGTVSGRTERYQDGKASGRMGRHRDGTERNGMAQHNKRTGLQQRNPLCLTMLCVCVCVFVSVRAPSSVLTLKKPAQPSHAKMP